MEAKTLKKSQSAELEEFHCVICGKPLHLTSEAMECSFSGKTEKADYVCEEGHYVCEGCRLATPEKLVREVCVATKETDPMKIVLARASRSIDRKFLDFKILEIIVKPREG